MVDPSTGELLGADEPGVLEVDSPRRAGHLPAGWLRTSDRARIDADGFVWILGRVDDVIVRGGFKVDLGEIERAALEHELVADACAVGLPDERLGPRPASMVAPIAGHALESSAVLAWVRDRVAPYAVPVEVRVVDAIPRTSTFKHARAQVEQELGDARA